MWSRSNTTGPTIGWHRLFGLCAAIVMSIVVVVSTLRDDLALGSPLVRPWLPASGIAYAVMATKIGFIPGCVACASLQIYGFLRNATVRQSMEARK